ncbi:MAG TPA: VWA-like domain-containing protein [Methanosarcina sp.]|nr:VWA-like domain-containing protein [Methanosarcina sp.]
MTTLSQSKTKTVTDPKIDAAAIEKLVTARIGLLLRAPFFGSLATRMKLKNADDWCPTAATDGRFFYYNSAFIHSLPLKQLEFLVGHEVLHAVYEHMFRRDSRDPQVWNIAADYCTNQDLVDQRIGEKIPSALLDHKYQGMSAEEVYEDLMKNASKINLSKLIEQLLDEHLDPAPGSGENEDKDNDGDEQEGSGRPQLSPEDARSIRDELREALLQAVQTVSEENIPGNVKRLVRDITEPKINWRDLINQRVQSIQKSDFTWMRPSRRGWHMDAVMPGMKNSEMIEVAVSLDSSGSISREMLQDFLAEVRGIMTTYDDFKIHLWCIDTEIYNYQVFTPDNMDEFDSYELMGNGGNTFERNWSFMREIDLQPKLFIMFTDGYPCPNWCGPGDEEYCDTIFLLHSTTSIVAPFGVTTYYDNSK